MRFCVVGEDTRKETAKININVAHWTFLCKSTPPLEQVPKAQDLIVRGFWISHHSLVDGPEAKPIFRSTVVDGYGFAVPGQLIWQRLRLCFSETCLPHSSVSRVKACGFVWSCGHFRLIDNTPSLFLFGRQIMPTWIETSWSFPNVGCSRSKPVLP